MPGIKRRRPSQGGRGRRYSRFYRTMSRRNTAMRSVYRGMKHQRRYHQFKRTVILDDIGVTTANVNGSMSFSLNQLPNSAEFTALFDEYRIKAVRVRFICSKNSSDVADGATFANIPGFYTAIDLNDAVPVSVNELCEYDTFKVHPQFSLPTRFLRPRARLDLDPVGFPGGRFVDIKNNWLRCDTPGIGISHYGLKYVVGGVPAVNASFFYKPIVDFYFECRGTK